MENLDIRFWFEPSILEWKGRFVPCLILLNDSDDGPQEGNPCIHLLNIFADEEEAYAFSYKKCQVMEGLREETRLSLQLMIPRLRYATFEEYYPFDFYKDEESTPHWFTSTHNDFVAIIEQRQWGRKH